MNSRNFSIGLTAMCLMTAAWLVRAEESPATAEIKLEALKWPQFLDRIASNKQAKFTVVDAWATTCGPCKENFPHLVEMDRKYRDKGLAVISLSLDDNSDKKALVEAEKFLREKKAKFTNILLDEEFGVGFEKLNIGAIPAVFLYGPDGKEIARFTMDDTRNQFTYDDVEKAIAAVLTGKPIPKSSK
jgi:thiol-disulfide isomerase/thioredoxin